MRYILLRLLEAMGRRLVGSRRIRSALVAFGACAMMVVAIATFHNESLLRAQTSKMTRAASRGALMWESQEEAYWRNPFDLFGSEELKLLKPIVENYLNAIRRLRYSLLSANRTWTPVEDGWTLLNGYDADYFTRVSMCPQIHTVFLTADFNVASQLLPVRQFYDYAGECGILTDKQRAIYHNGDELLNKTCRAELRGETLLNPMPVDRTMFSLGLPFHLSATSDAPTGLPANKVILTFLNIIQNGVVTAHGEVLSGNIGVMTQRCSHSWYKPQLPSDSEQLPLYDEVFTITQQTIVWYYHSTIEDLPRAAPYLELLRDNPHIKVHVTPAGFHQTMLGYLGVAAERLVSGAVRGRIVYLPAGTTCGRPPVFNTQLLAAVFRQRIQDRNRITLPGETAASAVSAPQIPAGGNNNTMGVSSTQDTVILIRRSSPNRQFRHHDAIVEMLRAEAAPRGLRVRVFADDPLPPLPEYMRLFQRARLVVAPHGAGLTNLLFAQPRTAVIEGLCEMEPHFWFCFYGFVPWLCHSRYSRVSLSFRNLATVLGQHYAGVNVPEGCLHVQPTDLLPQVRFYLDHLR